MATSFPVVSAPSTQTSISQRYCTRSTCQVSSHQRELACARGQKCRGYVSATISHDAAAGRTSLHSDWLARKKRVTHYVSDILVGAAGGVFCSFDTHNSSVHLSRGNDKYHRKGQKHLKSAKEASATMLPVVTTPCDGEREVGFEAITSRIFSRS